MRPVLNRAICVALLAVQAGAAELRVEFEPRFNDSPLVFDSPGNITAAGQDVSVTRLDFLLSGLALRRADGTWKEEPNWYGFIGARDGATNVTIADLPVGTYDRVRFHVGLEPSANHADAAQWPAGHPLNPGINQLYWDWSKEYVFLALEGNWQDGPDRRGFSYHLATDRELMNVELPLWLDLRSRRVLRLVLDVAKIFSRPNRIELGGANNSTHSRTNDLLAGQVRRNIQNAFSIGAENASSATARLSIATNRVNIGPEATPYRFTFPNYFPRPDLPRDNPLTVQGVALGSKLFFDKRLSADNTESCATCHNPGLAFSQNQPLSRGVDGLLGDRNAMPLENLAWKSSFFWDGRAASLRGQVLQPIQNPVEMHASLTNVVAKIGADPDYPGLFAIAFGSREISSDRMARALEQFLIAQVSYDSKFDRARDGKAQFTDEEARGFVLFNTEYDPYRGQYGADCFHCHGGPLFRNRDFANNGLDSTIKDPGLFAVTKRNGDQGKFAVPSLRNVAVTGPYMHDGRFQTLEEVIEHYCAGTKRSATLDANLAKHPDGGVPLNEADKKGLVAFLKTLTDERYLATGLADKRNFTEGNEDNEDAN